MLRGSRLRALLIAVACLASVVLYAQQRFTSSTSLLTFDVSVLDRDGNPVAGLTPADFAVTLNKEAQPVRTMVFLATQRRNAIETVPVTSSGVSTATSVVPTAGSEPDPKLLVVMLDDMSIYPTDSKGLFVAAERFIETIPARDWVGVSSTSGRISVNPSLDRTDVVAKLRRAFGAMNDPRRDTRPFVGLIDALEADSSGATLLELIKTSCGADNSKNLAQLLAENPCASEIERKVRSNATFARLATRNQLDNYTAVINAMAAAPGVKQLVILTGGVALRPADSLDFVPVAKAAAAAGVQITMLMEEPDPDAGMQAPGPWAKDQQRLLQQAQTLAEMSGGQFFRVIGQADRFYQRVLTSASSIYRLGIDLPKTAPPDGNYRVTVTVKRPGVTVLASRYAVPLSVTATPAEPRPAPEPAAPPAVAPTPTVKACTVERIKFLQLLCQS